MTWLLYSRHQNHSEIMELLNSQLIGLKIVDRINQESITQFSVSLYDLIIFFNCPIRRSILFVMRKFHHLLDSQTLSNQ